MYNRLNDKCYPPGFFLFFFGILVDLRVRLGVPLVGSGHYKAYYCDSNMSKNSQFFLLTLLQVIHDMTYI